MLTGVTVASGDGVLMVASGDGIGRRGGKDGSAQEVTAKREVRARLTSNRGFMATMLGEADAASTPVPGDLAGHPLGAWGETGERSRRTWSRCHRGRSQICDSQSWSQGVARSDLGEADMSVTKLHTHRSQRHLAKCGHSGKRRYRDHVEAVASLHQASNARSRAVLDGVATVRQEVRAYECDWCRGWHLTSSLSWGAEREGHKAEVAA